MVKKQILKTNKKTVKTSKQVSKPTKVKSNATKTTNKKPTVSRPKKVKKVVKLEDLCKEDIVPNIDKASEEWYDFQPIRDLTDKELADVVEQFEGPTVRSRLRGLFRSLRIMLSKLTN